MAFLDRLHRFNATFLVMHTLGLEGMPRRIVTYPGGFSEEGWGTTNTFITLASFLGAISVLILLYNIVVSWKRGEVAADDPWGMWAVSSSWLAAMNTRSHVLPELRLERSREWRS